MTDRKPQITFFGSGPVAAQSLELLSKYCDIEAVITKPQPAHHKEPFPVLEAARQLDTKVFTPFGKKELSELFKTHPVTSRLGIVIDYGFIINQDVIDYFPLGIINSHFSILPQWRGADPISFAILSGQKTTGVSLMVITAGMDEGPLIAFDELPLSGAETTPELTGKLIGLSDQLLQRELPGYIAEQKTMPQSVTGREESYSRKLAKEDGLLDTNKPAVELEREVRAFIEWPRSRIMLVNNEIIVTKAHVLRENHKQIGNIWLDNSQKPKNFGIQTSNGVLVIDRLKPAGKPEMPAEAFLAGYRQQLTGL